MDDRKHFPTLLKFERLNRGWSRATLATHVGCDTRSIMRWERGIGRPRSDSLQKLCALFDKSVEEWGLLNEFEPDVEESEQTPDPIFLYREEIEEAPGTAGFCGRLSETTQLQKWITTEHRQLITILGMGGMGKTTLAAYTMQQVCQDFTCVFWRSLKNAPPLTDVLRQCLQFLSLQQGLAIPENLTEQLKLLVRYLREQRCLLVLDNLEAILQPEERAGRYRAGYENYADLFQRLGEGKHQSCLLLTSREKPAELVRLEGQKASIRSLQLEGLPYADGLALLKDHSLQGSDEQWATLVQRYAGNPLALKLVAASIHELFGDQIEAFLLAEEYIFGDIDILLQQQFQRLSPQEQELLYWLAIEREALPLEAIRANLLGSSRSSMLLSTLESLGRRSLLEKLPQQRFFLQPVILEYASTDLLRLAGREFLAFSQRPTNNPGTIPPSWQQFAFIRATASDYLRKTQIRLLLAPLVEQLISALGRTKLTQDLTQLLEQQRQVDIPGSYLAGNVLNLLLQIQGNLRGLNFSDLTIRQAYLQNAHLPETNFSGSAFRDTVFTNTFGAIISVAFHPSGELLAAGTATGEIWLYQVAGGIPIHTYKGHTDGVWALSFSPDGELLASSSDDRTIRVWHVASGEPHLLLRHHSDRVRAVAFSPDGTCLASGSNDRSLCLWDSIDGQLLKVLQGHSDSIWSLAFHPDGQLLASGSTDRTVRLWDLTQPAEASYLYSLTEHTDQIRSVAFHPDGQLLASASDDTTVRLWDLAQRRCLHTLRGHTNHVWSVAFSPDGNHLGSASEDYRLQLWDYTTGACLKILQGHTGGVRTLAFSSRGLLASGGDDQTLRLWDSKTGSSLKTLQGYTNRVRSLAWTHLEDQLVSTGENQEMYLWDLQTGQLNKKLPVANQEIRAIAANPTISQLASVGSDQLVHLWNLTTGQHLRALRGHTSWIWAVTFSPNGRLLASGGEDHQVIIWDVQTNQKLQTLTQHQNWIRALAFSADGTMLASGGHDRTIRLWDTATGTCLRVISAFTQSIRALVFHPDQPLLFSASEDGVIRAWDASSGVCKQTYTGHLDRVVWLDITADGKNLVSCSDDLSLRIWDLSQYTVQVIPYAHTSRIRSVVYNLDGTRLASCSDDGTIKIWDTATLTCVRTLISERPYERLNIARATGLTEMQRIALEILGAIEEE
jgi:WD40 repeat protein/transcriptional regulator with XRE-family HTH domain